MYDRSIAGFDSRLDVSYQHRKSTMNKLGVEHKFESCSQAAVFIGKEERQHPKAIMLEDIAFPRLADALNPKTYGMKLEMLDVLYHEKGSYSELHIDRTPYFVMLHVLSGRKLVICFEWKYANLLMHPNTHSIQPIFHERWVTHTYIKTCSYALSIHTY